jgi:hypothetical protein
MPKADFRVSLCENKIEQVVLAGNGAANVRLAMNYHDFKT